MSFPTRERKPQRETLLPRTEKSTVPLRYFLSLYLKRFSLSDRRRRTHNVTGKRVVNDGKPSAKDPVVADMAANIKNGPRVSPPPRPTQRRIGNAQTLPRSSGRGRDERATSSVVGAGPLTAFVLRIRAAVSPTAYVDVGYEQP